MLKNILIVQDANSKTRDDALRNITKQAIASKIIDKKDEQKLFNAFLAREKQSTTGFQDHIAIPHAQIDAIKQPAVIINIAKNELSWQALDNKPIITSIALLIPKKDVSNLHVDVLSKISTLLLDEKFRKELLSFKNKDKIKASIEKALSSLNKETKKTTRHQLYDIVGVSACATGVAHTYMAQEALEKEAQKMGLKCKIETQGQKGQENVLTEEEIENAKAVIIAADINVELDRFVGKKLLSVKTNDAIGNPKQCINQSLKQEPLQSSTATSFKSQASDQFKSKGAKTFMKHLLSGVSRMIPFIVFSGIVWAILNAVLIVDKSIEKNEAFRIAKTCAEIGFGVFIAMMGGFIAESIAGRAALAPGFIGTFAAANSNLYFWWKIGDGGIPQIKSLPGFENIENLDNVGLSLFAAIMMGFAAGYLVKWVNTWKVHKLIAPIMPIIFIPVVCSSVLVFPFIFLLSGPLGYCMNGLVWSIAQASKINGVNFLMGLILGCMIGFDMGGPINKIAGTTATSLITIDPRLMGAVAAAIPVAPLGCAFATFIGRKLFNDKERAEGVSALGLGFFGISEGAIPFAVNRPKQVLIANIIGSGVAGGLAFLFYCGGYVGMWGGPITAIVLGERAPVTELAKLDITIPVVFGGGEDHSLQYISILWFFVAIIAGSLLHAFIFISMIGGKDSFIYQKVFAKMKKNKKANLNVNQVALQPDVSSKSKSSAPVYQPHMKKKDKWPFKRI